jgi:hypothetical protein
MANSDVNRLFIVTGRFALKPPLSFCILPGMAIYVAKSLKRYMDMADLLRFIIDLRPGC